MRSRLTALPPSLAPAEALQLRAAHAAAPNLNDVTITNSAQGDVLVEPGSQFVINGAPNAASAAPERKGARD